MATVKQMPGLLESTAAANPRRPIALTILSVVTALAVALGLYMALVYAGTDRVQGEVQRIFYIHMPAFFGAFFAFSASVVGGIMYLRTRNAKWDTLALAGVEVGMALAAINLVTGMIWAYPIWNTWWTWDPRLTAEAIMILTYSAYLMLRQGIDNVDLRRRFAAVYSILAITTAIATIVITRLRPDTIHPVVTSGASSDAAVGSFELAASQTMGTALGVNMVVWAILVPLTLVWYRIRLQNLRDQAAQMKLELLEN